MPLIGYHSTVQDMMTIKRFAVNGDYKIALTYLVPKHQVPPSTAADTIAMSSSQEWMDGEFGNKTKLPQESWDKSS